MPIAASIMPMGTMIFGPNRGTKIFVDSCAASTNITIIGRNDTPVCIGEYCSEVCR